MKEFYKVYCHDKYGCNDVLYFNNEKEATDFSQREYASNPYKCMAYDERSVKNLNDNCTKSKRKLRNKVR